VRCRAFPKNAAEPVYAGILSHKEKRKEETDVISRMCFFGFLVGLFFTLAKQELYRLSHTSSPLCSGYFRDGVS
jgi:hypothetical protein